MALVALLACTRREPPPTPSAPFAPSAPSAPELHAAGPADASPPAAADPPGTYMGRTLAQTMSYRGADWLDRPDRDAREQPEHVLDVLAIRPGATVADVGAGTGYFSSRLARRVGPAGRVLATDLQPEMLAMLRARLSDAGLTNVIPVLATAGDAHLPRGQVDLVLMVDVYHELSDPKGTLAQIRDALTPDGRLALVEYRGEDLEVPIKPEHKMTLAQIQRELRASGFVFERSDESLPDQRIVVFRR
jgi:ubiquinone/menaquinone biosynthesis C-methylase UbiE